MLLVYEYMNNYFGDQETRTPVDSLYHHNYSCAQGAQCAGKRRWLHETNGMVEWNTGMDQLMPVQSTGKRDWLCETTIPSTDSRHPS